MIDVKQAVSAAVGAFRNLAGGARAEQILLEEVEMVRDNGRACWAVTISVPVSSTPTLAELAGAPGGKDYKVLNIDAESGAFISMKIRKV